MVISFNLLDIFSINPYTAFHTATPTHYLAQGGIDFTVSVVTSLLICIKYLVLLAFTLNGLLGHTLSTIPLPWG